MATCHNDDEGVLSEEEEDDEENLDKYAEDSSADDLKEVAAEEKEPVKILLLCFMFMFQGYGVMVGGPAHALKHQLALPAEEAAAFQDAAASFQLAKMAMRVLQIAFLPFIAPNGIVYLAYVIMFIGTLVPVILVWGAGVHELWVVYLQYSMGGIAIGLFEGTFLSVISSLGKSTKTFAIMGAPLGFATHNIILGLLHQWGMPAIWFYIFTAICLPIAMVIFYKNAPAPDAKSDGKGFSVIMNSMKRPKQWVPAMIPWFIAKFVGNFVLENGFPLLFNTFNTEYVPFLGGADSDAGLISFQYYTALWFFPFMAAGDTISRRVPQYVRLGRKRRNFVFIALAVIGCLAGESMYFLLIPIVTGIGAFIANFGNGFIYGLSAKFIDQYIPEEHRYASYNMWCLFGDIGGYVGQSSTSVVIAHKVCEGHNYEYVCHESQADNNSVHGHR